MKLLILLILFFPCIAFCQVGDKWDYPIKPGTTEWKSFKNNAEKVQSCQIPNDLLTLLKTPDLLNICLNYPLLPDIFAFNNIKDGFNKFERDFNGFRELLNREDAANELLKKYKAINPSAIPVNGTILEKGNFALKISFIELFISHPLITEKISNSNKKEIIEALLLMKEKKKHRITWYQTTGIQTNYMSLVSILQSSTNEPIFEVNLADIYSYIYLGNLSNLEILDQIDQAAIKYLKNK